MARGRKLEVRLDDEEMGVIEGKAAAAGLSVSEWIRGLALGEPEVTREPRKARDVAKAVRPPMPWETDPPKPVEQKKPGIDLRSLMESEGLE